MEHVLEKARGAGLAWWEIGLHMGVMGVPVQQPGVRGKAGLQQVSGAGEQETAL